MLRVSRVCAFAALLLSLAVPGRAEVELSPAQVALVRDAVYPALVNLTVVNQRFGQGRAHRFPGAGSGVIMTPEGHVLTNFHVAGKTARIEATLTDGRVLRARVVVHDPLTDLSVLALEAPASAGPFPHADFGDSRSLRVGDTVFAMGNPLALSSSMTQGIVSNSERVFTDFTGSEMQEMNLDEDERSGLLTRWIQHDALILPGNSGGPLVDLAGRVVGINELGGGGMGFAIPSKIAQDVLTQALEKGKVERGWLGFSVLPVQKIGREDGALVSNVLVASAAEEAGLAPGDVLLAVDGEPVTVRFFEEVPVLYQRIADLPPGSTVSLEVERNGENESLEATVESMPAFRGEEEEIRDLGVTAQDITRPMAISRRLPSAEGLLVTGVRPGSPADNAKPRLADGDVIRSVAGHLVVALAELQEQLEAAPEGDSFAVSIWRDDQEIVSVVPPRASPSTSWGGELPKAWIGIRTQVLTTDLAKLLGVEGTTGFRVTQVLPWTAASDAGLAVGDLLLAVDDEPLEASRPQDSQDLNRIVEELTIGESTRLTVLRGGDRTVLPVRLEARPRGAEEAEKVEEEELELQVRDLTFMDRIEHDLPRDLDGVLVMDATMGGWAHMAGLRLDDVLLEINDRPVGDVEAFQRMMESIVAERPDVVKLFVRRGERTHFVLIEPDWDELLGTEEKEAA